MVTEVSPDAGILPLRQFNHQIGNTDYYGDIRLMSAGGTEMPRLKVGGAAAKCHWCVTTAQSQVGRRRDG
jgi:hypothetical protein